MRKVWKGVGRALGVAVLVGAAAFFYFVHAPSPALPKLSAEATSESIHVGDRERTFLSYVPKTLKPAGSLVLVLHGTGQTGRAMRETLAYEMDVLADTHDFAVAYPDGYKRTWNDCRKGKTSASKIENIDDVGFLNGIIDRAVRENGIDPRKVYLFGFSNGGQMAYRFANDAPERVAAMVTIGSSYPVAADSLCAQDGPTPPTMLVAGTEDPIVPFEGGPIVLFGVWKRGDVISARATAEALARRNGLTQPPVHIPLPHARADDPTSVMADVWMKDAKPDVAFYIVRGGGHTVPQPAYRFPRLFGRTSADLDTPLQAVAFFRSHTPVDVPPAQ